MENRGWLKCRFLGTVENSKYNFRQKTVWGSHLQRANAVEIIKEIGESCKFLNPSEITLEEVGGAGYFEIHVKCEIDDEMWERLKHLAKKHALGMKVTGNLLVIYGPVGERVGV